MAVPIENCCGLGCNNCILDRFIDPRRDVNEKAINLFNQKGYQKFTLKEIKRERRLVYQFYFELKQGDKPFTQDEHLLAPPISYLMLRAPRDETEEFNSEIFEDFKDLLTCLDDDDDDDKQLYRSPPQRHDKATPEIYISRKYTPFEVNEQMRTFKIIVKLEPFGKMSRYLTTLRVGAVCEFKGPFEAFNYVHESVENYIVFTQGISIVSAFRLVKEIIYESAQTRILVVSCFKNINETFLREDFFKLSQYWCLKHHMFLSENIEPEVPPRSGEKFHNERLSSDNFKKLSKELKFFDSKSTQVLISGRESFIENVEAIVKENSYKKVSSI